MDGLYNIAKGIILEVVARDGILKSLQKRNIVLFWYDDPEDPEEVKPGYREVEPYVYGKHYTSGNDVVRGWLIRGISKTGDTDPSVKPGWRLFRVDRMKNWTDTKEKFEPYPKGMPAHSDYNPNDKHMTSGEGRIYYAITQDGEKIGTAPTTVAKEPWWKRAKRKIKDIFHEEYNNEGIII